MGKGVDLDGDEAAFVPFTPVLPLMGERKVL